MVTRTAAARTLKLVTTLAVLLAGFSATASDTPFNDDRGICSNDVLLARPAEPLSRRITPADTRGAPRDAVDECKTKAWDELQIRLKSCEDIWGECDYEDGCPGCKAGAWVTYWLQLKLCS